MQTEYCKASWYNLPGNRMANGDWFDPQAVAVAHKTLPLGKWVLVTNTRNGKSVCAPVTDRGPYIKGRCIDGTKPFARKLGYLDAGTADIKVTDC